ncbi:MAG TPA: hypothetical protein VLH56_14020 [Dissulfurispiraceae bacterium]|nr:hypothetical protein [Dissulfurispiraceae bacterium]
MTKRPSKTIKLEGFEEVMRKLGDPRLSQQPMEELLTDASKIGQSAAIKAISGGTGIAERSINYKVFSRTMWARVYTMIARKRAMSIDRGRKPGDNPSIEEIASWYFSTPFRRHWDMSRDNRSKVVQIWQAIKEHGAKGKNFIPVAREEIEKELPRLQQRAIQRLEELAKRL